MSLSKRIALYLLMLVVLAVGNFGLYKYETSFSAKELRSVQMEAAWPTERRHKTKEYISYSGWVVDRVTKIGSTRNITGRLYEEFVAGGKKTMYFDMYLRKDVFSTDPDASKKGSWAALFYLFGMILSIAAVVFGFLYGFFNER